MSSSYKNNDLCYGDIFKCILFLKNPKTILEIGILDGYSLEQFVAYTDPETTVINAYDIFEEFNGNHADKQALKCKFKKYTNVTIDYGNFYNLHTSIDDSYYDVIHIDIANDGSVYDFVIENYISKLSQDGIIILEGGSSNRDEVYWMKQYNKQPIRQTLNNFDKSKFKTIGDFPSITILKKL